MRTRVWTSLTTLILLAGISQIRQHQAPAPYPAIDPVIVTVTSYSVTVPAPNFEVARVRRALADDRNLADVKADIDNNSVLLQGKVGSQYDKNMAENIVRMTAPRGLGLVDYISVEDPATAATYDRSDASATPHPHAEEDPEEATAER